MGIGERLESHRIDPSLLGEGDEVAPVIRWNAEPRFPCADRPNGAVDRGGHLDGSAQGIDDGRDGLHEGYNLHSADWKSSPSTPDLQIVNLHNALMKRVDIDLTTKEGRLRYARSERYGTAKEAAEAMGVPYGTYSGHEKGSRGYNDEDAVRYGKFFRKSPEWLLFGVGDNQVLSSIPLAGLVGLGERIHWYGDDHVPLTLVEIPYPLPKGCFALEARGNSQFPRVKDGELVVTRWHDGPVRDLLGVEAVLETKDSEYLLKTLRRGSEEDAYNLETHNGPTIENVEVKRAGRVMMILPSKEWVRLDI